MRLFVAVDLPPDVRHRLAEIQAELRSRARQVRWVRPEAIHLTLKFLGEVEDSRRAAIEAELRAAIAPHAPFALQAAGIGVFPERGAPRIVWVGLTGDLAAAIGLWEAIEAAMERCGFAREGRLFAPHLTIGRIRDEMRPGDRAAVMAGSAAPAAGGLTVTECVLFRSHLDPGGARYQPLARFPLCGGAAA